MVAANLTLPSTGTQPSQRGNKRTEVYYFYQSADGQHVYMHSINTRYYHKPIHLLIWGSYFDALATYTFVCGCCFNPVFFLFIVFLRFMKWLRKFLQAHIQSLARLSNVITLPSAYEHRIFILMLLNLQNLNQVFCNSENVVHWYICRSSSLQLLAITEL